MSDAPRYRATAQVYLDRLYEPGQEIPKFLGIPNRFMEPLNEAAEMAVLEADESKRLRQPADPRDAEISRLAADVKRLRELIIEYEVDLAKAQELAAARLALLETAEKTIVELKASVAPFDRDGDGKPGGGAKKGV